MEEFTIKSKIISKMALQRMPFYLNYLTTLKQNQIEYVSSRAISEALDLNEVQVRKDLASVSESSGMPKKGFQVEMLIKSISDYLGYNNVNDAILVGAGQIGMALLSYKGFEAYGLNIIGAFDIDEEKISKYKKLHHITEISDFCKRLKVKIGIITTPAAEAQKVCDLLIASGVLAIWNFAPIHLKVPDNILIQNENMAASLALLSNHLREKLKI